MLIDKKEPWGYYVVHGEECRSSTILKAEFGFSAPPGLVRIELPISRPQKVRYVHGNYAVAGWGADTNASIVADVWSDSGDVLASCKVQVLGKQAQNVPFRLEYPKAIDVQKSVTFQFYVDLPEAQTFSWALVLT